MIGDAIAGDDIAVDEYKYPFFLNLMLYLNFPLLVFIVMISVSVLSDASPAYFTDGIKAYLNIDLQNVRKSLHNATRRSQINAKRSNTGQN